MTSEKRPLDGIVSDVFGEPEVLRYTTMFSDLRFEIHDIVADGDVVCSRWTSVGTHDGEVLGIAPTGNSLNRTGVSWQRIENGKFVETWVERDGLGLARDIGAVPPE